MLTHEKLLRAIVLERTLRLERYEPSQEPLWLMMNPYTWEEVEMSKGFFYSGVPDSFISVPVLRKPSMEEGIVMSRWPDGTDVQLWSALDEVEFR